jgi:hypothetical protein
MLNFPGRQRQGSQAKEEGQHLLLLQEDWPEAEPLRRRLHPRGAEARGPAIRQQ